MITWENYQQWLSAQLRFELPISARCPPVHLISTDSRSIQPGQWFLPLSGKNFDGHQYIESAIESGAGGYFCERQDLQFSSAVPVISVKDCLQSLKDIAHGWRMSLSETHFFALTGSVGKTTCKELLKTMLEASGPTFATLGNQNNDIGVPLTLLQAHHKHKYVIVEMGARQPGDIAELTNMASADTVCCLNAGNAHIGIFGSYQTLLKTKLEIFSKGPSQSTLVANFDQKDVLQGALSTGKNIVTFGQSEGADIRILEVQWTSKGELIIGFDVLGSPFSLTCGSAHVSYPINIAAALAMAVAARVPVAPLSSSLVNFKGVDGRYKVQDFDRFTIIDDCYNASPASMIAGFQSMVKSYPERKKILVLGDMLELGELSQSSHFDVGKEAVKLVDPELLVCIGQESLQTAAGAQSAGIDAKHLIHLESVDQLITKEIKYTDFGDLIYIKGSRGIKLDKFLKSLHL